jgi:2'-5' RNA ligase superfamily
MAPFMTWLVPASGPEGDRLAATIDKLAAEHGGPRFQPHVTVVATFDSAKDAAAQTLSSLVADVPPVELTFVTIGHEQTYFRSLYLIAAPSTQLQELQRAGQRAWGLTPLPHLPHLSLLYSDLAEERKRPIIGGLDIALPLTARFDAVELWVREPRGVRDWYRVVHVPLRRLA